MLEGVEILGEKEHHNNTERYIVITCISKTQQKNRKKTGTENNTTLNLRSIILKHHFAYQNVHGKSIATSIVCFGRVIKTKYVNIILDLLIRIHLHFYLTQSFLSHGLKYSEYKFPVQSKPPFFSPPHFQLSRNVFPRGISWSMFSVLHFVYCIIYKQK